MPRKSAGSGGKLETPQDYDARISETLKTLHKTVLRSYEKKRKMDKSLGLLDDQLDKNGKSGKAKLKAAYIAAIKDSEAEAELLREALDVITGLRSLKAEKKALAKTLSGTKAPPMRRGALMVLLGQAAAALPLWVGKLGEEPPPLTGAVPEEAGHELAKGDAVAGLVKGAEDEQNWILGEVRGPAGESGTRWELEDVDEEQRERYTLPRKKIVPLPMRRANPTTHPAAIFAAQSSVLALYPQTTCFYKGVVEQSPAVASEEYLVAFEDPSYPTGFSPPLPVPQRYVIAYKEVPGARLK